MTSVTADRNTAPLLIVGLGNPGAKYAKTRHNAGFWFCERLAAQYHLTLTAQSRFFSMGAKMSEGERSSILLPQTFMNASGRAVSAFLRFYQLKPAQMLVVHDELDLPPGQLRLKFGGGAGGHNGLKDIIAHSHTQDFWRLRIGIGHPGQRAEVVNYVLKAPRLEESIDIDRALDRALNQSATLLAGRWDEACSQLNIKSVS